MPSTSEKQARFMAACSHGADYESCPPKKVAKKFNKADQKTGILKKAMSFKEWLEVKEAVDIDFDPIVQKLAKKHNVSPAAITKQMKLGIDVEKEHTSDADQARKIALDHLEEKPDYYTALAKMEKGECDK